MDPYMRQMLKRGGIQKVYVQPNQSAPSAVERMKEKTVLTKITKSVLIAISTIQQDMVNVNTSKQKNNT